jgi:hypothetical protein
MIISKQKEYLSPGCSHILLTTLENVSHKFHNNFFFNILQDFGYFHTLASSKDLWMSLNRRKSLPDVVRNDYSLVMIIEQFNLDLYVEISQYDNEQRYHVLHRKNLLLTLMNWTTRLLPLKKAECYKYLGTKFDIL